MGKPTVEDVLQQGIHGQKQLKPEERRKFLGTIRERVLIALKKGQVLEKGIYPQVEQLMKEHHDSHLYMNGTLSYEDFSKYLKIARENNIDYTIVTNKEYDTHLGLVLACPYAVDKEEIYVKAKVLPEEAQPAAKKGLLGKLFGWIRK
ncbi:hypothetical protein A8F94_17735 [Bacillus sp. FJAT-27225]|uniref:YueI family protein n=1 Tax=Bacillus sp. FJAT-27225 TaxID=1743144 RepID=UPI00080C2FFF|nr:YueI family protein [Bacillus sp. FJAT-27225]OCA82989.1 hypothetical protein A8F94_17735 [Bacillus sp. FJAT-27225]